MTSAPDPETLDENQARRLRVTCQSIDRTLGEIENTLRESGSHAAFPEYISDLSPAQRKTIEDYIARIRSRLRHVLDGQGIDAGKPHIPLSRAVRARLYSIDIAAEELRPGYMRGFGELSDSAATDLDGIAGELQALVVSLERVLDAGSGQDLAGRLRRLQEAGNDLDLLTRIEHIVTRRGLVEFRNTIVSILDRAEDTSFEIAVFGRVSSGKSSLLNAILGSDFLPVGVTPVTAVPTRIIHGEESRLAVSFADRQQEIHAIPALSEYATEQKNPGNTKHVTRITVTLPAPRLANGVSFVDTPGLGSLATSGAAETLAYLPKCDLGVVLIDAGSTLTEGDVRTVLALQEAAVPAHVLLSKADLLDETDCEKTIAYVNQHILAETGLDLPVHPVSVRPSHHDLLDRWFDRDMLPLFSRSQELRAASLQRKIGMLRESVIRTLERKLRPGMAADGTSDHGQIVEIILRKATGRIAETRKACEKAAEAVAGNSRAIYARAAAGIRNPQQRTGTGGGEKDAIRDAIHSTVQERAAKVRDMAESLALSLYEDLLRSAGEMGAADMPAQDEFLSLVRGMPVFDCGTVTIPKKPFALVSLLGEQYAQDQLVRNLRREIGPALEPALASYVRVLRDWSERVMTGLSRKFDTYAGSYRAQAERFRDTAALSPEDRRDVEEDLAMLGPCSGDTHKTDG